MVKPLTSAQYDVQDLDDAMELYQRNGWTDGLPVVPPTEAKVRRLIEAAGREPDEALGVYGERRRSATVEKLAVNAVMAGCLPEYFPVVLAISEAMLTEAFGLHPFLSSLGGPSLGFVVNGPIRNKIGLNYRDNVLGPGCRANATIGRAIRLIQMNVLGAVPAPALAEAQRGLAADRAALGQPGKYVGYHLAENEEDFPSLAPLHVERGYSRGQSVVTVFGCNGHTQIQAYQQATGEELVDTLAQYLVNTGRLTTHEFCVVVIPPENAQRFVRGGWTKADIRLALFERTRRTVAWMKEHGWAKTRATDSRGRPCLPEEDNRLVGIARTPDDILVVIAGGEAGGFLQFLLPYVGDPVSRVIRG